MRGIRVLAALVVVLTGCEGGARFSTEVDAEGNGEVAVELTWTISDEDLAQVPNLDDFILERGKTRSEIEEWVAETWLLEGYEFDPEIDVEVTTSGQRNGLRLSRDFAGYEEMVVAMESVGFDSVAVEGDGRGEGDGVELQGSAPAIELPLSVTLLGAAVGNSDLDIETEMVLALPVPPDSTDADDVDGDVLSWVLSTEQPTSFEAKWYPHGGSGGSDRTILWLAVLAMATVLLAAGFIWMRRTRASNEPAPPA
jgi:hypothetical protein